MQNKAPWLLLPIPFLSYCIKRQKLAAWAMSTSSSGGHDSWCSPQPPILLQRPLKLTGKLQLTVLVWGLRCYNPEKTTDFIPTFTFCSYSTKLYVIVPTHCYSFQPPFPPHPSPVSGLASQPPPWQGQGELKDTFYPQVQGEGLGRQE